MRGVVRLDEDVLRCGRTGKRIEVDRVDGIVGVPDDGDIGILHRAEEGGGIFLLRTRSDDEIVQARNGVVEFFQRLFRQVNRACVVQDVQLRAHDEVNAVGGGADDLEVVEVQLVKGAGQRGRMVGDAEEREPLFLRRCRHFPDGAVRVHAGDRMRVDVDDVGHGRPF